MSCVSGGIQLTPRTPPRLLRLQRGESAFSEVHVQQFQREMTHRVCLGWKLVEGEANLALHGLGGKVAGLHVSFQQKQLVSHLPGVDLRGGGRLWWHGYTHVWLPGFCPHWSAVVVSNHHSAFLTITQLPNLVTSFIWNVDITTNSRL